MSSLVVNIAILSEGRVLLTQREDFEVWCLPGGALEPGESLAQAALREGREETGLQAELDGLVGIYSRPNWHQDSLHAAVLAAHCVGGSLQLQEGETIAAGFFGPDEIPADLLFGQRPRILDALAVRRGVIYSDADVWPFPMDLPRCELYALRDRSGLSRLEFYRRTFGHLHL